MALHGAASTAGLGGQVLERRSGDQILQRQDQLAVSGREISRNGLQRLRLGQLRVLLADVDGKAAADGSALSALLRVHAMWGQTLGITPYEASICGPTPSAMTLNIMVSSQATTSKNE
ncbi:hypothetical protein KBZ15_08265 [Cyanobium sp. BA20m-p-22]|uniref:hypothetical protein n=1 Tax=Cyanobium sp. BA20m-p-22 TaxID=2823704 RepID=UPI0020CC55AF|nr:hypothetical protein [Cyanobium sp. BA20m-p-22]MCP9909898.1 hypothetical protein [Cyanobium sp. BA20m-p-22]